jgi:hypothetical protein
MKNYTKVKAIGGIGNQLLVLAFGLAVSSKLRTKLIVEDNLIHLGSNNFRKMEISNLIIDGFDVEFKSSKFSNIILKNHNSVIRKILWKFFKLKNKIISEKTQLKSQFKFTKGQTFSGYYQDWFYADYINENNPSLDLKLKNPTSRYLDLAKEVEQTNPILVHVRLGDYLNFPKIYSVLPNYYFQESLEYFKSNGNTKFWLFTEELHQVNKFYPDLVDKADRIIDKRIGLSDLESFILLCQGTKLIASNSTFSMWAAWYVNKNGNSAVVPLQLGIKNANSSLIDQRWDRFDLEKRVIIPGTKSNVRYLEKKREFLSKFD